MVLGGFGWFRVLVTRGIHTNTYMFHCVYLRCLLSLHAVHVCCDEKASGHHHFKGTQSAVAHAH